jgi:hypothetical protein
VFSKNVDHAHFISLNTSVKVNVHCNTLQLVIINFIKQFVGTMHGVSPEVSVYKKANKREKKLIQFQINSLEEECNCSALSVKSVSVTYNV